MRMQPPAVHPRPVPLRLQRRPTRRVNGHATQHLVARHRASGNIENLNSVLRPYLAVQKHAQQGFLNLFRFYWNTRNREWGRHTGTSAHEVLTGEVVPD
jgi:hypothetical protein